MSRRMPIVLLAAAACSPGVGSDPGVLDSGVQVGRDASGPVDVGFVDSGTRDGSTSDAGTATRDGGPPPSFPFTGVFDIFDSQQQLFVREVDGNLLMIVGAPPYVFIGSIDAQGRYELTAPGLIVSGCNRPRITGTYERSSALYELHYKSCNGNLEVIESDLRGLFSSDYDHFRSGTYDVTMTVTSNPNSCFTGNMTGNNGRWAVSFLSDRTVIVYTAHDLIATPNIHIGRAEAGSLSFSATHHVDASDTGEQYAMSGAFRRATLNDPLEIMGDRDVYDTVARCWFRVIYSGVRIASP